MKKKGVRLLLLLSAMSISGYSQNYLTVEKALETARANNASAKMANLDERIAYSNFRQTDAVYLPQVDLGYNAVSTNNPLNAFGFLLNQAIVTSADFDPTKLNDPGAAHNFGAKADIRLPLINVDMIFARKGAKAQQELYKHKAERTKQYVDFEVRKAYSQLQFAYKAKQTLEQSLVDVKLIHQSTENFYKQGLIQESDVLNALVQVNTLEAALAKAKSNIYNASEGLALLMGIDRSREAFVTDSLAHEQAVFQSEEAMSLARPDIQAMDKAIQSVSLMEKSAKMSFIPRLNAFGTYQLNDYKAFTFRADSYVVGIALTWNVFSGNQDRSKFKSYQYQKNKLQQEKELYIQQGNLEVNKTYRELADTQVEIMKHSTSVRQAGEALRILSNRHREGLASTTDLLAAQAQLAQQQLQQSQAIMAYNITRAYLQFLLEK